MAVLQEVEALGWSRTANITSQGKILLQLQAT